MSQQILQINFQFNVSGKEFENASSPLAQSFADIPGCQWKIWLMNEGKKEAGGIYLFSDKESVERYKGSDLFKMVNNHPAFGNFSVKQFDILEELSAVTRAPLLASLSEHS
jgi:hypothetical protein